MAGCLTGGRRRVSLTPGEQLHIEETVVNKNAVTPVFLAVLMSSTLLGCAGSNIVQTAEGPMPAYCLQNNAAQGAAIGAAVGAGLGALAGGQKGALVGGALGVTFGGLTGAQADAKCRQVALRNMAERALAANEAARARGVNAPKDYGTLTYVTPSNNAAHVVKVVKVSPLAQTTSSPGPNQKAVQISTAAAKNSSDPAAAHNNKVSAAGSQPPPSTLAASAANQPISDTTSSGQTSSGSPSAIAPYSSASNIAIAPGVSTTSQQSAATGQTVVAAGPPACVDLDDGAGSVEKVCKIGSSFRRASPSGQLLEDIT